MVVLVSSEEYPAAEAELVLELCERRVAGLIIVPTGSDHGYIRAEMDRGLAVVFVDRPAGDLDADTIVLDNLAGGRSAVAHLAAHGHRRIAHIGDRSSLYTAEQRVQGYRAGLEDLGLSVDDELVRMGARNPDDARAITQELLALADPPTAIFTGNNLLTLGVLQALRGADHRVALVGFDDFDFADMVTTPVTVVRGDTEQMGIRAAELLFERIGGDRAAGRTDTLPVEIVARGSGEMPPG
jgi:LacI family transcriptional regulator